MSRGQLFILVGMTLVVCLTFAVLGAIVAIPGILPTGPSPGEGAIARTDDAGDGAEPFAPADSELSLTPMPTATASPTVRPTETSITVPTPTATLVVITTPTATKTPTVPFSFRPPGQPAPTATPGPSTGSGGTSTGGSGGPTPIPSPTYDSRFPLRLVEGPLSYTTTNHIFVVYFEITDAGNKPLPGYRVVGEFRPGGIRLESLESCNELCVGSGPEETCVYDPDEDDCNVVNFDVQKGNVVFEGPFYATGTWTLYVVEQSGARVSGDIVFNIKEGEGERRWFYVRLVR